MTITVAEDETDEDAEVTTTASSALQAESHMFESNVSTDQLVSVDTDDVAVDCVVSRWSQWSACSVSCGRGFKTKIRTIKVCNCSPKKLGAGVAVRHMSEELAFNYWQQLDILLCSKAFRQVLGLIQPPV